MCAIIGSFNDEKLKFLMQLNAYRGNLTTSLSYINIHNKNCSVQYNVNHNDITFFEDEYVICHQQAPTSVEGITNHPANIANNYLWHNGILKQSYLKKLNDLYDTDCKWDTYMLLYSLYRGGFDVLSDIDGTFACLYMERKKLYAFRNELAPLFYDKDMNISSTRFEGCLNVPANKVFEIDLNNKELIPVFEFTTHNSPYYFGV